MSVWMVGFCFRIVSGAMYVRVPWMVLDFAPNSFARPPAARVVNEKSIKRTSEALFNRMLSGLTSLWIQPRSCIWARARHSDSNSLFSRI